MRDKALSFFYEEIFNFPDFCRQGKCLGADFNDCIQHPLRHHFLPLPLLGRNDQLSGDVPAHGGMVNRDVGQKSIGKRNGSGHSKAYRKACGRSFVLGSDHNGCILLHPACTGHTQYPVQHHFRCNQLCGCFSDHAAFFLLCTWLCIK